MYYLECLEISIKEPERNNSISVDMEPRICKRVLQQNNRKYEQARITNS